MSDLEFGMDRGDLKIAPLITAMADVLSRTVKLDWTKSLSPDFWSRVAKDTVSMAHEVARLSLADVLVGAWKTHKKFKPFTDPVKYPPEKVSRVPVQSHKITSKHRPYIDIVIDGTSQGKIPFELELELTVDTGVAVVQAGRIMAIEAGRAKATGRIKCDGVLVGEKASREFAWKDSVSLGKEGMAIA